MRLDQCHISTMTVTSQDTVIMAGIGSHEHEITFDGFRTHSIPQAFCTRDLPASEAIPCQNLVLVGIG
jgi:hypothetical protein